MEFLLSYFVTVLGLSLLLTSKHYFIQDRVIIMPNNLVDNTALLGDQDAQRFKLQCNILQTDQFE